MFSFNKEKKKKKKEKEKEKESPSIKGEKESPFLDSMPLFLMPGKISEDGFVYLTPDDVIMQYVTNPQMVELRDNNWVCSKEDQVTQEIYNIENKFDGCLERDFLRKVKLNLAIFCDTDEYKNATTESEKNQLLALFFKERLLKEKYLDDEDSFVGPLFLNENKKFAKSYKKLKMFWNQDLFGLFRLAIQSLTLMQWREGFYVATGDPEANLYRNDQDEICLDVEISDFQLGVPSFQSFESKFLLPGTVKWSFKFTPQGFRLDKVGFNHPLLLEICLHSPSFAYVKNYARNAGESLLKNLEDHYLDGDLKSWLKKIISISLDLLQDPSLEAIKYTSMLFLLLNSLLAHPENHLGWERIKAFFTDANNASFANLNDLLNTQYEQEHKHNNYKVVLQQLLEKLDNLSEDESEVENLNDSSEDVSKAKKLLFTTANQVMQAVIELKNRSANKKTYKLSEILKCTLWLLQNSHLIDDLEPVLKELIKKYNRSPALSKLGHFGTNKKLSSGATLINACRNLINAAHAVNEAENKAIEEAEKEAATFIARISPLLSRRDGSINN